MKNIVMLDRAAMRESLFDTGIATAINFPLNFVLISIAFYVKMDAFTTTVFCTSILFVIALIRKYMVRVHFKKVSNE